MLDIECGSGTYVRSLGRDLADVLGTRAVMSGLVRSAIGEFHIDTAVDPNDLTQENVQQYLLSPLAAVSSLPRHRLSAAEIDSIRHGRFISIDCPTPDDAFSDKIAAIDQEGQLVAILSPKPNGQWGPLRNFR